MRKGILAATIGVGMGFWLAISLPLIPRTEQRVLVKITKDHKTAAGIVETLAGHGVLRHPRLFRQLTELFAWDRKMRPGTYYLRQPEAWPILVRRLIRGETYTIKITILEGWRAQEIAQHLEKENITQAASFLQIVSANRLEGFLFPSTYFFEPESDPADIVNELHGTFKRLWAKNFADVSAPQGLPQRDAVTLASIVQREAMKSEEMPLIAGVYLNRLSRRWRLEADPTVQYALGYWKQRIFYKDLRINSPYNTYQHYGLPPGPICSPGIEAIRAVLYAQPTDYFYFVANGDGTHAFFKTLKEHNRKKASQKKQKL